MGVTISLLSLGVLLVVAITALGISRHRKLDAALKSLATAFKFD